MKKIFLLFLCLLAGEQAHATDVKLSQLPLGSASATNVNDSFPYVDYVDGLTKRITLYDLIHLPTMVSTYAPLASPTFTGTVTAPTFIGALTGNASTASAFFSTPTACSGNQFANSISANGDLSCSLIGDSSLSGSYLFANGTRGLTGNWNAGAFTGTFNSVQVGSAANQISGLSTIVNTGTLTLPTSSDTLVGRNTSDTFTNKNISGASNALSNIGDTSLSSSYLYADGTRALTASWNAGQNITAPTFIGNLTGSASGNLTYTPTQYGLLVSGTGNTVSVLSPSSSANLPLIGGGSGASPSWAALGIAGGGTGQTSKALAFDALSPNSTLGDLTYYNGSTNAKLSGNTTTTKNFLAQTGTGTASAAPSWATLSSSDIPTVTNSMLAQMGAHTYKGNNTGSSATPLDLTATQLTAELNAMVGDTGTGGTKGLVPAPSSGDGAANKVLRADGTWGTAGTASPLTTKGDVYTYSTTNARLPVGTDGQILMADSTQTTGLKFANPVGGSLKLDTFSGDGSTTVFTLSTTPVNINTTNVFISGVYQQKATYSVSGNQITFTTAPPSGTSNVEVLSGAAALPLGGAVQPTITKLTSGSGNYTTPANVWMLEVLAVGGGGGGSGSGSAPGAAGAGGNTTFGTSLLTANGGNAGTQGAGATGGTATIGSGAIGTPTAGGSGGGSIANGSTTFTPGGTGGNSILGGGGSSGSNVSGGSGATNSGGGGGGGGITSTGSSGGGGGAGGGIRSFIFPSPSQVFAFNIGAAGTAGPAGTGSGATAGGSGALGYIEIREYYSNGAVGTATNVTGIVAVANGGTGQTTRALAYPTPTVQKFTSGSGTYTTPANALYIRVRMVGAGGGGAGSGTASGGSGGNGGNTTFGTTLLVANGGTGGTYAGHPGGLGGTASLGTGPIGIAITGQTGQGYNGATIDTVFLTGGQGGASPFGGAGTSGAGDVGTTAIANTGSGGGGGGTNGGVGAGTNRTGAGGGSGGFVDALISGATLTSTFSFSVGASGSAGTAGTSGQIGGAGSAGFIEVTEYYQ